MKTLFYKVTCLTDLHMGSGDNNFHIIDKSVERDPITKYPMMNASGVKGALREYFEKTGNGSTNDIFGSPVAGTTSSTPGKVTFFAAKLLGRPVRASQGNTPYYIVTTLTALKEYNTMISQFCGQEALQIPTLSAEENYYALPDNGTGRVGVEGISVTNSLEPAFGQALIKLFTSAGFTCPGVVILKDEDFRSIPLPVSARNYLVHGISDNLWYEENVPARSSFWFAVRGEDQYVDSFEAGLGEDHLVQFGGDASIGKGFCLLEKQEG